MGASSLRLDPFGGMSFAVRSAEGVVFAVPSFQRRVFCGSILSEALSLRFDPFGGMSFAVRSVEGVVFAVQSV
jgi:hypothetical protein